MGQLYRKVLRPLLFLQEAETAHERGVAAMSALAKLPMLCRWMESFLQPSHTRPIELFGLRFPNAVGMAAGMDKNGLCWRAAGAFGFGHVEIGTITARPQPGKPRPRVFRVPELEALVNRMGFNNDGAEAVAARLKKAFRLKNARTIPLGINIGKSKAATLEEAAEDYLVSFNLLAPYASYFTINVSSPNTPELRRLQERERLQGLLSALREANLGRARKLGGKPIPLLLKIAPDLSFPEIDDILSLSETFELDGLIATNTSLWRPPGASGALGEEGGLSGRPIHARSVEVINYIHRATNGRLPIVGCGGIMDGRMAGMTMDAGARLIQVYTGFVYGGPFFPAELAAALCVRQRPWV